MNKEEIEKEWSHEVDNEMPMVFIVDGEEEIARWWIGKIDQVVEEERASMMAKIEGKIKYWKKIHDESMPNDTLIGYHADSCIRALSDLIA